MIQELFVQIFTNIGFSVGCYIHSLVDLIGVACVPTE
jgi:hypothetical protein